MAGSRSDAADLGDAPRLIAFGALVDFVGIAQLSKLRRAVVDHFAEFGLRSYFAELDSRFSSGFDPAAALPTDPDEMRLPLGLFVIARVDGRPVGCGALKLHGANPAEIKRLWVSNDARGLGIGRGLLAELESHSVAHGIRTVQLDTNRSLVEAIGLYRATGYYEIEAFNQERYADFWFEKKL